MSRLAFLLYGCLLLDVAQAADPDQITQRLDADFSAGRPLVAHVVVALCDNIHQGIVPVSAALGDGANPRTNLYWGALYGVRTYFRRSSRWEVVPIPPSRDARVLDRVLFRSEVVREGRRGEVFLLAEAWNGRYIAAAIRHFLEINRGEHGERLRVGERQIDVGGLAHVAAFVGHNGLMDFAAPSLPRSAVKASPHASVVLACQSDAYFTPLLREDSMPLLTTTGLMAPEAYTLEAALTSWFSGQGAEAVRRSAAGAYARYQHTSAQGALRLFRTSNPSALP